MASVAPDIPAASVPAAGAADPPSSGAQGGLPQMNAAEFVDRPRFHQRLTLPATDDHGELTVSYAIAGCQDASAPTVLFIGGMFGGRYTAVMCDYIGEKMGIRIVATDR